jgi:hypothetical protein
MNKEEKQIFSLVKGALIIFGVLYITALIFKYGVK